MSLIFMPLSVSLFLLALAWAGSPDPAGLRNVLDDRLATLPEGVVVGIAYEDMHSGNRVLINEMVQMHAASTMKVPVMMEVFKPAEQGQLALTDSILVTNRFHSIDKIPELLPAEVTVAHKTGNSTAIDHDAAIVYLPGGRSYSLTILTRGITDHDDAQALVAELSQIIYRYYIDD